MADVSDAIHQVNVNAGKALRYEKDFPLFFLRKKKKERLRPHAHTSHLHRAHGLQTARNAAYDLAADYLQGVDRGSVGTARGMRQQNAELTAGTERVQRAVGGGTRREASASRSQQRHMRRAGKFAAERAFATNEASRAGTRRDFRAATARANYAQAREIRSALKVVSRAQGRGRRTVTQSVGRFSVARIRAGMGARKDVRIAGRTAARKWARFVGSSALRGISRHVFRDTYRGFLDGQKVRNRARRQALRGVFTFKDVGQNVRKVIGNGLGSRKTRALEKGHLSRAEYDASRGVPRQQRQAVAAAAPVQVPPMPTRQPTAQQQQNSGQGAQAGPQPPAQGPAVRQPGQVYLSGGPPAVSAGTDPRAHLQQRGWEGLRPQTPAPAAGTQGTTPGGQAIPAPPAAPPTAGRDSVYYSATGPMGNPSGPAAPVPPPPTAPPAVGRDNDKGARLSNDPELGKK